MDQDKSFHGDVPPDPEDDQPDLIVGRERAEDDPEPKAEDDGEGRGHPLPSSEKARHGSIPESIERTHGHGAN